VNLPILNIYTLIFNKKENENEDDDKNNILLNIAIDSIQTYGFYKTNCGIFVPLSNLIYLMELIQILV